MPGHVLDACFVEDLQTGGLLAVCCMNLEQPMVGGFAASSETELAPRIAELTRYGVQIRYLTASEVNEQQDIQAGNRALSAADAEALVIARAEGAVLLTGDGPLRKAAGDPDTKVDVRGVIGELQTLVGGVKIDPPKAICALNAIVASGSRLPSDEVERVLRQWNGMVERRPRTE